MWGWSNHLPETARLVAKAFYAGRERKRSNCYTDGETYWLFGHAIARRTDVPKRVAYLLEHDGKGSPPSYPLSFRFAGYPTPTTCRHLRALGVEADLIRRRDDRIALISGKEVEWFTWYTKDEIDELDPYVPPVKRPKFVNLTMELFPDEPVRPKV